MNELSVPKYSPNIYQYISGIIENALKQTEQILLNLKTQRNDTVINVKNATVKLNNEEKKKPSTMHMQNVKQTSNDNDKTLLSVKMQYPQKVTNSSWQIMDLLCFPIENEERNLKFTDRIFVSIDQKSIMLMREYDNLTNCIHQKVQTKCNQCYQKQIKMIKLQQQQAKLDQQKGISEQFPQRQQRIQQIQKPKADENGRFTGKEKILSLDQSKAKIDPLNIQEKSKSISKMDEPSAESSVEFLEEEVPMKSENKQTHKKRTKNNLKLKSHRGKQIRKSNSTEIDKRMISARNGNDSRSTMRSSSDTSVPYAKMNAKKKLKRKTKKKKTKASSTLEHELPSQQPPSLKENEMSDERWNETYQIFGKPKNGRKNKKQLSMEQFGTDQPVSKQYRGVRSMVEPIGCQKIVMKGWKPHYKVKKIWLQDLSKE